ncbi:hypothetical protein LJC56_00110 [Christensenellaceae bacterium OttesenSCG-928-K19]|nr:hypothetical protein [Christensenellaceae bacterium OttesenSCG-928-K19]
MKHLTKRYKSIKRGGAIALLLLAVTFIVLSSLVGHGMTGDNRSLAFSENGPFSVDKHSGDFLEQETMFEESQESFRRILFIFLFAVSLTFVVARLFLKAAGHLPGKSFTPVFSCVRMNA